jgi:hypothetical protein
MNMGAEQQLEESMEEEQVREALNAHWRASAVGNANAEHDIYDDDAICDYPEVRENRRPSWQKESKTGVLTYHADVRYQLVKNTAV